ncbi:MAG: phage tail protein [Rhodocyclaceae bacterium]|nr:phage tail protein [Rhodocyclaceae bacterium]
MTTTIQFTLTDAGLAAAVSQAQLGLDLRLTHVQVGSGNRSPNGSEVALLAPQQAVTISGGSKPAPNQLRVAARFASATGYPIAEIGLWSGDPNAGGVLFAYWSQPSGVLAQKFPGIDFIFSYDMTLGAAAPGNIAITVDPTGAQALALVAEHEDKADPHPQYLLRRASNGIFIHNADFGDLAQPALLGDDERNHCGLALDLAVDGQGESIDLGPLT